MTEQQKEPEYIITTFQLKQLQEYANLDFICQAIRSCPLADHDKKLQEELMDKFGILHGEDATRLNDYINNPEPVGERARDIIEQARDLAK